MKRIYIYVLLLAGLVLTSCNGLLKEDSGDLMIPSSVNDYAAVFRGEAYPERFNSQIGFVHLMTDDVEMGPLDYEASQLSDRYFGGVTEGIDENAGYGEGAYIWQSDYSTYLTDGFWSGRYDNILACNTIIDALPDMSYDSDSETGQYRALAAQAYALRAYNYFCLINTYAKPWSEQNLNEPGVVIRLTPNIDVAAKSRATIGEVYDLINSDIKKAEEYAVGAQFDADKLTTYKPEITEAAIYFLAARIALFQEDWDGVIEAGEKFLAKKSAINDLNAEDADYFGMEWSLLDDDTRPKVYVANQQTNDEVVFGFGKSDGDVPYLAPGTPVSTKAYTRCYEYGYHTSWDGDNSLIKLYESDDLRLQAYFLRRYNKSGTRRSPVYLNGQYQPMKYRGETDYQDAFSQAWRTPEVYLDLAEAYARKSGGVSTQAIDYLNQLRVKKFKTGSTQAEKQASDFANNDALVKFVWEERRRELCFEEIMRFWDMRRQGMPAQTHRLFTTAKDYSVYNLPQGSANYVLPIPADETDYNDGIVNNQRDVIGSTASGTLE